MTGVSDVEIVHYLKSIYGRAVLRNARHLRQARQRAHTHAPPNYFTTPLVAGAKRANYSTPLSATCRVQPVALELLYSVFTSRNPIE